MGTITGEVGRGQTGQAGDLSLTVEEYMSMKCMAPACATFVIDPIQTMEIGGFAQR